MNVTVNGTNFNMTGLKPLYGVIASASLGALSITLSGAIQHITLVVALMTGLLFFALTYHNYRIARRKDIREKQEYENYKQNRK